MKTVFWKNPVFYLICASAAGIATILIYVLFCENIYRDVSYCYAYAVREAAQNGNWSLLLDPGLPVLSMGCASLFALAGMPAYPAWMMTGGLFFLASIWPLYGLLKRFVSPLQAGIGCLLFMLTPKLIRFSGTGLIEAPRNFFLILGFWMMCRLAAERRVRDGIWFGIALGGLSLSRPEGLPVAGVFFCLLAWGLFRKKGTLAWRILIVAGGVFLLSVLPKLAYNLERTGYPTLDTRYNPYLNQVFHFDRMIQRPPDYPAPKSIRESSEAFHNPEKSFRWGHNLAKVIQASSRGAYELYLAFAAAGLLLCVLRWRKAYSAVGTEPPEIVREGWRWEYTAGVVLILTHFVLYFIDCSAYRYYTFLVPLILPFVMTALGWIWDAFGFVPERIRVAAAALILLGTGAAQIGNGWSFAFATHDEADWGRWLASRAEEIAPGGGRPRVWCGYSEVCYFSGFEYANTSLNSKSLKLQAEENKFDAAVFPEGDETCGEFASAHGLVEKRHPFPGKFHLYLREKSEK